VPHRHAGEIDVPEAANVYRRHGLALGVDTFAERVDAARSAEAVPDAIAPESSPSTSKAIFPQ
jgi:hypothetical protein